MKNRTIIGIIGMVVALVVVFLIAPLVAQTDTDTTQVLRLKQNISRGTEITTNHLEMVTVKTDTVPNGVINDPKTIVGKYASTNLFAGDYITAAKLSSNATSAEDVFINLDGKVAISVPITSFAGGLSGKLQNGDIVRFYVTYNNSYYYGSYVPGALQWVKVITTTTGNGIDQNEIQENDDGSYDMPSTVTVLANESQAKLLAELSSEGYRMHLVLVYRGEEVVANDYMAKQEQYFEDLAAGLIEGDALPGTDNTGTGNIYDGWTPPSGYTGNIGDYMDDSYKDVVTGNKDETED